MADALTDSAITLSMNILNLNEEKHRPTLLLAAILSVSLFKKRIHTIDKIYIYVAHPSSRYTPLDFKFCLH